jgi:DNA-binding CsgD family transcriptional regulator
VHTSSPDRAERDVAALADRDLTPEDYRRAVLDRVLRAVPADAACVASADPGSLALVAHTSQGIDRRGADRLYEAEYGTADVATHRSLAHGAPARVLSDATQGDPARSHRYRTLLRPMGWEHELRAAASDRGGTWGFLHLYRAAGRRDFSADELALVERVGPHVARGLRAALLRGVTAAVPASRAPAVWVLDEACRLVQATPGSETVLAALRDDEAPGDGPPEVLVGLAVMARAAAASAAPGAVPEVPRLQVPTADGDWLALHASVLLAVDGSAGQVVITSMAAGAADLLDLSLLAYRLTPAERAAVVLVLAGRSTKQIADELVLSPHTVQDRMQDVFAKVGVRSRRELVATLAG